MDPVSAAGIGLAVVSVAAQCFTGAMQALHLISTARGLKPELKYLSIRLRLEQQRCYNWASASGLLRYIEEEDEDALDANLTGLRRTAIFEILVQIEVLVTGFIKYKGKYSSLVPDSDDSQSSWEDYTSRMELDDTPNSDVSDFVPNITRLWQHARLSISSAQLPQRIRWAVQDKVKYEGLIDRLRELNDALLSLVDSNLRSAIHQSTHETRLSILQLHSKVDDLTQLIKALLPNLGDTNLHIALESREPFDGSNVLASHLSLQGHGDSQIEDDVLIAKLARFKVLNSSIEEGASLDNHLMKELSIAEPQAVSKGMRVSRSSLHLVQHRESMEVTLDRSDAIYYSRGATPQQVWIEWKRYVPTDARLRPSPTLLDRVQKLSALLGDPKKPRSLRVPLCLGYFDDAEHHSDGQGSDDRPPNCRFGFVFLKPEKTSIISLHDLLERVPMPPLTRRVALAKAVANCILSLHSVNWLHKNLSSSNILLTFPCDMSVESLKSWTVDFSNPYISGFDYARPAQRGDMTEMPTVRSGNNLYRHPDAHGYESEEGMTFKKSFDVYSLGVVLVEIAAWRTVDDILGLTKISRTASKLVQDKLLNENAISEAIEAFTGARFEAVVRTCLTGPEAFGVGAEEDQTHDAVGVRLSRGFHEKVMRPLEEIRT